MKYVVVLPLRLSKDQILMKPHMDQSFNDLKPFIYNSYSKAMSEAFRLSLYHCVLKLEDYEQSAHFLNRDKFIEMKNGATRYEQSRSN